MSHTRYVTSDGLPPFGGRPPGYNGPPPPPPYSASGHDNANRPAMPESIVYVVPRPDIGGIPGWRPWDNGPEPPTNMAPPASTNTVVPSSATHPPAPPGGNLPGTANNPLVLGGGLGYIFPPTHTTIHVIEPGYLPSDNPRGSFRWRAFKVPTAISISDLIEQVCQLSEAQIKDKKSDDDIVSKRIVECFETGGGAWLNGSEFWTGDGKGEGLAMKRKVAQSLGEIGWDQRRGASSTPVWLASSVVLRG